ncbi:Hypothetical_protein [Hexamita inflata]|uniref:Hypothetical_protein n=1 Tax=Hexamita inflata TaxID=28002 RepID=A0AA86RN44_9EUKA|nr:Hypothetical protein HINF_LOCUS62572 [Hexamita inflata]
MFLYLGTDSLFQTKSHIISIHDIVTRELWFRAKSIYKKLNYHLNRYSHKLLKNIKNLIGGYMSIFENIINWQFVIIEKTLKTRKVRFDRFDLNGNSRKKIYLPQIVPHVSIYSSNFMDTSIYALKIRMGLALIKGQNRITGGLTLNCAQNTTITINC